MTEPDLGPLFRASSAPTRQLDVDAIIRRSRRRRLPRLVITTAVPIVAIVGLLGGGIFGLSQVTGTTSGSSSASEAQAPVSGLAPEPTAQENSAGASCVLPLPFYGPTAKNLVTSAEFPANGSSHDAGTVTLTNTGSKRVTGTVSSPAVVVTAGGTIVAQSLVSGDAGLRISLAPGESTNLAAALPSTWCTGSPSSPNGTYKVHAYLQLRLSNGSSETVTGPDARLTIGE